jgi:hypothetical protein
MDAGTVMRSTTATSSSMAKLFHAGKALSLLLSLPLSAQDTSFNDRYEPTAAPGLAPSHTPRWAPCGESAP